uniref:phage tail protein I n=1 Tax=Cupriavidus yeoncheonensis TaxID=1462994 RepID=UPI003F492008
MRLIPDTGSLVLCGPAHWRRCALRDCALIDDVVMLQGQPAPGPVPVAGGDFTGGFAGLAFDRHCRLFHPQPETGLIDYVPWGETSTLGVHASAPVPFVITAAGTEVDGGATGPLPQRPLALACDEAGYLYIADPDAGSVWLVDTWQQEIARRLEFSLAPLDVCACGAEVFVLLQDGSTWQIAPCDAPLRTPWPAVAGADRLSVSPSARGEALAWVLVGAGQAGTRLQALHLNQSYPALFATDVVSEPEHPEFGAMITLAMCPGEAFLRFRLLGKQATLQASLVAPHYDGRGIAPAPDGRIAYWTAQGLRHASPARMQYLQEGKVFGFALDSGHDQSRWGRIVVEACIPPGTGITFRAFSRDELDFTDPIDGLGAAGDAPVLSQHAWEHYPGAQQRLYRDSSPRPLSPTPEDGFALYDAPLMVPPGRYLWLVFELSGTRSKSPRLRGATVEYPGHDLLAKLPRTLWREPAACDFLFRYLMPVAAVMDEWEAVSSTRHRLLDARIAPAAALPWLAGFVALVLDPCWPEAVQRQMVLEAAALFRTRGTLASLRRMIGILTGADVVIIEHFRLRGGGVVGNAEVNASQAVLGVGYRIGGRIGEIGNQPLAGAAPVDFDDFAHRFTVTVVAALGEAQLECVRRLIEQHKPAHTDFTLCTAATSMRAGVGAHVGISSVVGKSSGFDPAIMGEAALGAGFLLGRPALEESPE